MNSFSIRVALCRGALASGTPLRLRIRGTSMLPALRSGDTVSIHPSNLADVLLGEVVVFARNRHLVVHRVVRRIAGDDGVVIVTRGDAQSRDDPPVDASEILGVVTALHRGGASHDMRRRPRPLARGVAWMVRHSSFVRSMLDRLNSALLNRARAAQPMPLEVPTVRGRT